MRFMSINPADGRAHQQVEYWDAGQLEQAAAQAATALPAWSARPVQNRAALLMLLAIRLLERKEALARLITLEMGKLIGESRAEIDKCAVGCRYFADEGPQFLADEHVISGAEKSYVVFQPLGTLLAVMPWNFPFWQVFRCAVPALLAGNTVLLKHAANVPQCALAIEALFRDAGFPAGVFCTLLVGTGQVETLIADPRIHAVSLTGSVAAGRKIAALAGASLKKSVLELGGSDPFIVLADADLDATVEHAVRARFQNAGQSCIAAKRFIVVEEIAEAFIARFKIAAERLKAGDPLDEKTTLAPLARADLRDELHAQVSDSIAQGALPVTGCHPLPRAGYFYAASILDHVQPGMRAYHEELFGPVASILHARDAEHALELANDSRFGLGASVWTADSARGELLARQLHCGMAFVNDIAKSDPRLPFGGIRDSGYGRELSGAGLREFVNIKTVWISQAE